MENEDNETTDRWLFTDDGITYYNMPTTDELAANHYETPVVTEYANQHPLYDVWQKKVLRCGVDNFVECKSAKKTLKAAFDEIALRELGSKAVPVWAYGPWGGRSPLALTRLEVCELYSASWLFYLQDPTYDVDGISNWRLHPREIPTIESLSDDEWVELGRNGMIQLSPALGRIWNSVTGYQPVTEMPNA